MKCAPMRHFSYSWIPRIVTVLSKTFLIRNERIAAFPCVAYIKLRAANLDRSLRIDFFYAQDDHYAAVSDICPIAELSRSNCGKAGTERNISIDSNESIVLTRESRSRTSSIPRTACYRRAAAHLKTVIEEATFLVL